MLQEQVGERAWLLRAVESRQNEGGLRDSGQGVEAAKPAKASCTSPLFLSGESMVASTADWER